MSLAVSRAMLRRSTFVVRRAGIRNASSTTESAANTAKEQASKAADVAKEQTSKASEGLSRVSSSAGSAISKAGSALGNVGGRTGRLIGRVQSLIPTISHYSRLTLEVGKIVVKERNMSPPTAETFQKVFQPLLNGLRSPSTIVSQPANILNRARNMSSAQWASVGVVAAEVIGFFSIGEMIGRFKITLPSSGAVANPQLFGHDESPISPPVPGKSRKRKRGQNVAESSAVLPVDIDFFGETFGLDDDKRKKVVKARCETWTGGGEKSTDTQIAEDSGVESLGDRYDEEESRRVLRSHKLKAVVIEDFAPLTAEQGNDTKPKQSKKQRRERVELIKSKKDAKRQIFPQPLTSFTQLRSRYSISKRLAENITEQGYKLPTEVQLGALPLLLSRNATNGGASADHRAETDASGDEYAGEIDLLTVAPTGSGKTVAFLIPIINSLLSKNETDVDLARGPRAIILAPTKELAAQIVNEARKLAKGTRVKAVLIKKGVEVVEKSDKEISSEQGGPVDVHEVDAQSASGSEDDSAVEQLPNRKQRRAEPVKAAILVATPLSLLNALKQRDGSISELGNVRSLVLDEADVLLDPLFREQTMSVWNACTHIRLRVGLWSATMGSNIESLVLESLNNRWNSIPAQHPTSSRAPLVRLVVGLKDSAIPNVTHRLIYGATEQGKLLGLRQLLHPTATPSTGHEASLRPPFLVFTQTIARAIALHSELLYDIPSEAGGSSRIAVLHADLSSTARDSVMARFRRGEVWVLITTDLLSRGVDFRGLNGVVNYDVPNSAAAYIHRVGRTGRAGREGGVAVTFYTQEDIPYVKNVANVIRASEKLKGKGEDEATIKQWLLDALPTPSKRDKQQLKKRGIEARRTVKDADGRSKMRISTKSGYERQKENDLKGAKMANSRREKQEAKQIENVSESEFEGFEA